MGRLLAALLLGTALVAPADARMHAPYRGHRITPATAAPLDGFTTPSAAYSFRKLKSNYAGSAIRIRRASDSLELDVGFVGNDFNTAAATAHCAATTCFTSNIYDQSGNGLNLPQATPANQAQLIFNCNGSLPCLQFTTATQSMQSGNVSSTVVLSLSTVGSRAVGTTGACGWIGYGINRLTANVTAANWLLNNNTTNISVAATDAAWHVATGVMNGAGTYFNIDGAQTTGSLAAGTTGSPARVFGAGSVTCNWVESVAWSNYALTGTETAALQTNQKSFWGTP